jgi:eukaryotic translation initiation factor 2C
MRVEKETEAAAKLLRAKLASQRKDAIEPRFPQRPGFGTKGKPVVLWANYFSIASLVNQVLHRYTVEVVEAQGGRNPSGRKLKRVVQLFLDEHLSQYSHDIVTDFKANLLSKNQLSVDQTDYQVTYRSEREDNPAQNATVYKIHLRPTGTCTVSDLMNYLTSSQASQLLGSKDEIIQALNILIGHYPKIADDIVSVGANRHFRPAGPATEAFSLGAGLIALRGFFVSVRAATARILVNVQVKHGAFFEAGPLEHLIHAFTDQSGPSKVKLDSFLKKISVDVIHIGKKNKAGHRIPRIKTIMSLATRDDGRGQLNPPIVSEFGAGSKDVNFFLESSPSKASNNAQGQRSKQGLGKKDAPASSDTTLGRYISVYDFFKQSKQLSSKKMFIASD